MKSAVIKHSIVIEGRKTSISIEEPFWRALKQMAHDKRATLSELVATIKEERAPNSNLSSAIRVHILSHLRAHLEKLTGRGLRSEAANSASGRRLEQSP